MQKLLALIFALTPTLAVAHDADKALYNLVMHNHDLVSRTFAIDLPPIVNANGAVTMTCAGVRDNEHTSYRGAGSCLVYTRDRDYRVSLVIVTILNEGAPYISVQDADGNTFALTVQTLGYTQ